MIPLGREWFKKQPASSAAIASLRSEVGTELPQEYFDLLEFSNGGEGPLPIPPYTFCLDSAEEATLSAHSKPHHEFFPGFFIFGGNGAGELIAFDLRGALPWPVVAIDATNINLAESVVILTKDFNSFLSLVGLECENA